MAAGLAVRLKKEISRNEVIEDVLKQRLGEEFTVTHKPVTKRMGKSFSPYSKSKHDICIMHKRKHFWNNHSRSGWLIHEYGDRGDSRS